MKNSRKECTSRRLRQVNRHVRRLVEIQPLLAWLPAQVVLAMAFSFSLVAHGQTEWDFAMPNKARCSAGAQLEMNECLVREAERVEQRLKTVFQRYAQSLKSPSAFRRSQEAWIAFREVECSFLTADLRGDSLYAYATAACAIDFAEKRIRDIERYESWDGGGGAPATKD
jgi:uncharacterized protein YecT (DUF1311 family)